MHAGEYKVSGAEVIGLAFHIGAHVAATARAGEVLTSSAVKDLMSQSAVRFPARTITVTARARAPERPCP